MLSNHQGSTYRAEHDPTFHLLTARSRAAFFCLCGSVAAPAADPPAGGHERFCGERLLSQHEAAYHPQPSKLK